MIRQLGLILVLLLLAQPASAAGADPTPECVVLLHGLWRTSSSMKAMEWHLEGAGYAVVNQSYPSLAHSIEELADMAVETGPAHCRSRGTRRIHFVTHSLRGVLLRQYLDGTQIAELQRVVMLGPPKKGSQLADYVQSLQYLQPLTPQAVAQLGTDDESLPLQLGAVGFDLGVIAGTAWQSALLPGFPNEVSDSTVAVSESRVKGMQDFLEVPVSHTFLMWKPEVLAQVVYFLQHGVFDHNGAVGQD